MLQKTRPPKHVGIVNVQIKLEFGTSEAAGLLGFGPHEVL